MYFCVMSIHEERNGYELSTDKSQLDTDRIHHYLSQESYWAKGIPKFIVTKSIQHSWCVGIYKNKEQIAFARVVTDYATFAYICDVYVEEAHRGKGLSKWMMEVIMQYRELHQIRRWTLATRDAHGLYKQFGFREPDNACNNLEIRKDDFYLNM